MNNFHISQAHEKIGMHSNLTFWISMINESQKVLLPNKRRNALDFGCGQGEFLQLLDLMDDIEFGLGVELDNNNVLIANDNNKNKSIDYVINIDNVLLGYQNFFDVVYSQEVLYTIENLEQHSKNIFQTMKKGAFYFATMGCHIENPLWSKRRKIIRDEETYPVFDYSLEQVAEIFHSTGFEVGLKRLPVEYFLVYHPQKTKDFSNSLLDLVNTSYENKMLFSFWKPDD